MVDGLLTEEGGPSSIEFLVDPAVHRLVAAPAEVAALLRHSIELSRREALAVVARLEQLSSELEELRSAMVALRADEDLSVLGPDAVGLRQAAPSRRAAHMTTATDRA